MSTFTRIAALFSATVVSASIWVAANGQSAGEQPSTDGREPIKKAREAREGYVLLTDGRLIRGVVSERGSEYWIEQSVGTMHFPKNRVEGAFDSVRGAYQYRLSQLPDGDSDERMKLAHWCLKLKLIPEAGELLKSVIALNANNSQAKAMLVSIEQAAARVARRDVDPAVRQAEATAEDRPEALDSAVLRNAERALGVKKNIPVIFDLPLPLAIKRTQEFYQHVQPLLQENCSKCHNGEYLGEFQLVPIRGRADRTPDALRANLDATLRLIDPKNPALSELLSSTLRPHGPGAKPRPIFSGSNDRRYKVLAEWANRLAAPKESDETAGRMAPRGFSDSDEVFAFDRNRSSAAQPGGEKARAASMQPGGPQKPSAREPVIGGNSGEPEEFPIPFAVSGVMPKLAPSKNSGGSSAKRSSAGGSSKVPAPGAVIKPDSRRENDDDEGDDDDDDDDEIVVPKRTPKKATTGTAKSKAKPLTIDPKLLERALQYRNSNRANPGS